MQAQLRRLHSPDVIELTTFRPEESDCFGFLLQVLAGPRGAEGEESFDVLVCTPEWLKRGHKSTDFIIGRHYLIVFEYDYDRLFKYLDEYCSRCHGETWQEIAGQLGRLGKWEFEDYKSSS